MNIKQAIVVNLKANMPSGRFLAQACHSSELAFEHPRVVELKKSYPSEMSPCTKIVLRGWGDNHLVELHEKALALGIPCALWGEGGFQTALAIGPAFAQEVDKVTGGMVLY